ncbi:TerB family tellurite resistance protein [bacterium]|nr:TerB family tellurite resistance protein [bacterium]
MQDNTIELMSPETKEWFAKAIVGMILADGRIDKAELEYLNNLIGFLERQDLVQSISNMLKNNQTPELEPLELVANEALEIVKHLTVMAVVDENLATREVEFLHHVANQLGLPDEIADRFLALAKEKLRRAKYVARLVTNDISEQVRCFDLTETSCMFYSFRTIKPNLKITLQLFKEPAEELSKNLYHPISAESSWCRPVQSRFGNFIVQARFCDPIKADQGLELIKFINADNNSQE